MIDDSPVILKLVSQTLSQIGDEILVLASGVQALQRIETFKPDLVILDVMMPELNGYEVCRQIRRNPLTAAVPVMLLTSQNALEEKVKGYEAGADDYVTKPFDPVEFQARVKALLRRAIPAETESLPARTKGKTIGVFALRGGTGVSTVAANVATGLAQLWNTPTALVDLALTGGHSALLLNLTPHATWADIARHGVAEMDSDLIDQIMVAHPSGVRVISTPRRVEQSAELTADHVAAVLAVLRARYSYVVLDLPHDFQDITLEALDQADQVLLLVAPELGSIMNTATGIEIFESLGYAQDKVRLALNQLFTRRYLAQVDIENALQRRMNVVIPYAQDVLVPALNNGTPAILAAPNTQVGEVLEDLAFYLSKEEHRNQQPAAPSPAWLRVNKRMQNRKK